jgi:hypothetical protein
MARKTYRLEIRRENRWWIVDVPQIDHRTQGRNLVEAEAMGRDLIAGALEVEPNSFDIDVCITPPDEVARKLDIASKAEESARSEVALAAAARRDAVRQLRFQYGVSVLDAARMLGVTRGRIYQLL